MKNAFNTLSSINVNEKTEKKNNLTYLSWAWAWAEVKKAFPDASYEIVKDEFGNPYNYSENLGYMCFTKVTIECQTLEMWLPVMDGANKAMKKEAYTYKTKFGEKSVEPASMFDINKTLMRCLVKNLAMFGMGLYIYAGEDLPETPPMPPITKEEIEEIKKEVSELSDIPALNTYYAKLDASRKSNKEVMAILKDKQIELK